jgi:hypothetical protein
MPLARIDLIKGKPSDYRRTIGDVVYKAMVEIPKAPENDRFQVINEHDADNFVYDPTQRLRTRGSLGAKRQLLNRPMRAARNCGAIFIRNGKLARASQATTSRNRTGCTH